MTTDVTPSVRLSLTELVAEEIRALMARKRVRQSQLARALGVSEQWVSMRLMGKQEIGFNEAQRIADFLNVDVLEFMPQREGRLVSHIGAARRQDTVPKVGSLTSLTKRPDHRAPASRNTAIAPIDESARRVTRVLTHAA